MIKIYIIMINYNGSNDTCKCLESIRNAFAVTKKLDYEVILIDNNSNNLDIQKIEMFLDSSEKVKIIKNKENVGFAAGNNIGLKYLQEQNIDDYNNYIWFLNNDTLISQGLIKLIIDNLPNYKEAFYFEMRNFNNDFVNDGLNYMSLKTGKYYESKHKNCLEYICGASIFMKYCYDFHFWNEDYFLYFEDADYSAKLKKIGYKFIKLQNAYYNHKINSSSSKNSKTKFVRLKSQKIFMRNYSSYYFLFLFMKSLYLILKLRFKEFIYFLRCKTDIGD